MDDWREKCPLGARHVLRTRPKDEDAMKDAPSKKLKQQIGDLVLDDNMLGGCECLPCRPDSTREKHDVGCHGDGAAVESWRRAERTGMKS